MIWDVTSIAATELQRK